MRGAFDHYAAYRFNNSHRHNLLIYVAGYPLTYTGPLCRGRVAAEPGLAHMRIYVMMGEWPLQYIAKRASPSALPSNLKFILYTQLLSMLVDFPCLFATFPKPEP